MNYYDLKYSRCQQTLDHSNHQISVNTVKLHFYRQGLGQRHSIDLVSQKCHQKDNYGFIKCRLKV